MKYAEAIAKLNEAGADAKMARPGCTLRKAKTTDEKQAHSYVHEDGSKGEVTPEDVAADDWSVTGGKVKAAAPPEPRPSSPAPPHEPKGRDR